MIVVRFNEPQEYHAPGQEFRRARIFIDEQRTGLKEYVVGMAIYGTGMKAPFHVHKGVETMFIIHGRGRFGNKEKSVDVEQGDVVYFGPGEEHYLECVEPNTRVHICLFPARR